MIAVKFSVNRICAAVGVVFALLAAAVTGLLYWISKNTAVIWCSLLFSALTAFLLGFFILCIRRKLTAFSDALCSRLDEMMYGEIEFTQIEEGENLFYKINHRLERLYGVMHEERRSLAEEKRGLQELISDISHQIKTPLANLKIINATLLEHPVTAEKQKEFLSAYAGQLDKLDFLIQAMIKTSRLEAGVITLEKKEHSIYETLASALGGILLNAEQKNIAVDVCCSESLTVLHDPKWTAEALFNILDNAVKYTSVNGSIRVSAVGWEMHIKIDITDTGKGIPENHQANIFKRFYREEETHDIPGVGIGLYLARKIITMQGGYIKVSSKKGEGSVFSVFLPRK